MFYVRKKHLYCHRTHSQAMYHTEMAQDKMTKATNGLGLCALYLVAAIYILLEICF